MAAAIILYFFIGFLVALMPGDAREYPPPFKDRAFKFALCLFLWPIVLASK